MGDSMAELAHACYPQFSSLNNALNQNPCQIAHTLFQVCDSPSITRDDYTLYELDQMKGQHRYPPPNQWQATECICSMASYNLVQVSLGQLPFILSLFNLTHSFVPPTVNLGLCGMSTINSNQFNFGKSSIQK